MEFQRVKLQMVKDNKSIFTLDPIISTRATVELINTHEKYELATTQKIIVIGLNGKNKLNVYTEIATGVPEYVNFKLTEIFKVLLVSNCSKFILVCTRPNGDLTPSAADMEANKEIKKAAKIMEIEFLDHIIIGEDDYKSIMKGDK